MLDTTEHSRRSRHLEPLVESTRKSLRLGASRLAWRQYLYDCLRRWHSKCPRDSKNTLMAVVWEQPNLRRDGAAQERK